MISLPPLAVCCFCGRTSDRPLESFPVFFRERESKHIILYGTYPSEKSYAASRYHYVEMKHINLQKDI